MKQSEFSFEPPPRAGSGAPAPDDGLAIYRVAEVAAAIRELLESSFPRLRVEGEVSNVSRPQSGHFYFSLVDDAAAASGSRHSSAQLPCVVWRSSAARLRHPPQNGERVVLSGRIAVYEPRGTYQLIVDGLDPVGVGDLQRRFEALKERLRDEGLFAAARKRPLPFLPLRIGLITSPRGAAVQDFLRILFRRFPSAHVRMIPVRVQGDGADEEIVRALAELERTGEVDVIVLTRGGGSLEDLWSFNEEAVARAIADAAVPVVSAIGHEVDFTIADFVADARAQTPTHAAELVVPPVDDLLDGLGGLARRVTRATRSALRRAGERLEVLARRRPLTEPAVAIEERRARVDDAVLALRNRLYSRLDRGQDAVLGLAGRLEALSPLRVLARGYAIALADGAEGADGRSAIRDPAQVTPGERIEIVVARGRFGARVDAPDRSGAGDTE